MSDSNDPSSGVDGEGKPVPSSTKDSTESVPSASKDVNKVELMLKATGDAPILNKRKWAVERIKKVAWVLGFIQRQIKCSPGESVFVYVNQAFAPAPDVDIGTLYDCFGTDGKLTLHYCKSQAWG